MIWYRHWLELRVGMLIACAPVGYVLWKFQDALARNLEQLAAGGVPATLRTFGAFVPAMGSEAVLIWGSHAFNSLWLAMLLPWMFAGSGLGASMSNITLASPSAPFTLSLPLSRRRLLWTRLAAGAAVASVVFVVHLAIQVGILALSGHAVPFWWMALASLIAAALSAISITVLSVFLLLIVYDWVWWLIPVPALGILLFTLPVGRSVLVHAGVMQVVVLIGVAVTLVVVAARLIAAATRTWEI